MTQLTWARAVSQRYMLSQHLYDSLTWARAFAPRVESSSCRKRSHRMSRALIAKHALKQCLAFHALAALPTHVVEMQQLLACIPVLHAESAPL